MNDFVLNDDDKIVGRIALAVRCAAAQLWIPRDGRLSRE
jgi:hypothetical protein